MRDSCGELPHVLDDSNLVRAARQQPVSHTPVWFMRPASRCRSTGGSARATHARVLPAPRARRRDHPAAGAQARRGRGDLLLRHRRAAAAWVDLDIVPGVGPVVAKPIRSRADLDRLPELTAEHVPYITEAVQILTRELGPTPLIGFAGAPFTLASYLVEGGPSKNHEHTKALMYGDPQLWDDLCARLAQISEHSCGYRPRPAPLPCSCSTPGWGTSPCGLRALRAAALVARARRRGGLAVPRIHFGVGTSELLPLMGAAGADVVGVDFRISLADALSRLGGHYALQGNLDPALLFAPWEALEAKVRRDRVPGQQAPATSSTSATGCCPTPTRTSSPASPSSCTRSPRGSPAAPHGPPPGARHRLTARRVTGSPPHRLTALTTSGFYRLTSPHLGFLIASARARCPGEACPRGRPAAQHHLARRAGHGRRAHVHGQERAAALDREQPAGSRVDSGPVVGCEDALGMQPPAQVQRPPRQHERRSGRRPGRPRRARPSPPAAPAAPAARA